MVPGNHFPKGRVVRRLTAAVLFLISAVLMAVLRQAEFAPFGIVESVFNIMLCASFGAAVGSASSLPKRLLNNTVLGGVVGAILGWGLLFLSFPPAIRD